MINAFIRADSSEEMGTGHLMRSLTLAGELRARGVPVLFICRRLPGAFYSYIEKKGFPLDLLPAPLLGKEGYWEWARQNWRQDAEEAKAVIEKHRLERKTRRLPALLRAARKPALFGCVRQGLTEDGAGFMVETILASFADSRERPGILLVVDHYALDAEWERFLRPSVDRILVIDDLADRPHDCDFLLDQNFYPGMERRYKGLVPPGCKQFLGPEFALLRPEFKKARRKLRRRKGKIRRLLVFFGGTDPGNETAKVLAALPLLNRPELKVDVVVGAKNPHKKAIAESCRNLPGAKFHCQTEKMAELMARADLSVGAGGTATWERLYLELPTVTVAVAANQEETLAAPAAAEKLWYLGRSSETTPTVYAEVLEKIISASEKQESR
jgi:UDP-2,4-diacetamido-2,4,6-trideoxy-beta-L-altropyranose hydrolase